MVRPNDPFWDEVEEMSDGGMKCKFCGQLFAPTTSISRIKWHFSGEKGHGVSICSIVPIHVREEAFGAMCGDKKRHKITASSSSINDVAISTPPREPNNEVENWGGDIGRVQAYVKSMEGRVWGEETSSEAGDDIMNMTGLRAVGEGIQEFMHSLPLEDMKINDEGRVPDGVVLDDLGQVFDLVSGVDNLAGNHMDSVVNDRSITLETGRDALQATDQVGQVDIENTDWAAIANIAQFMGVDVENGTGGSMRPIAGADSSVQLSCNTSESRGDASTTCYTKLMGQAFEENKNAILSWLMNDEATLIGVSGIGGVGKTSLVKHIYNQLKQRSDTCHHIYWTSVSQDFSIYKLQKQIANQLDLDLSNEDDEKQRAQQLSEALMMKHKPIIILDNLWNFFDSEKVGIPMQKKGCKLIFTTRLLEVCQTMGCLFKIEVRPLCPKEAWTLFMEQLMHDRVISPEVEQIAKSVTKVCAGLPLAIVTTARSMRGVADIHEWGDMLRKLKESEVKNMEHDVFQILRLSCERLDNVALKQCFLYCALFPKDYLILRDDLIGYLIDEGIIEGMRSRRAEFDKGHAMLNKLQNVCLLESCSDLLDDRAVKMHDLIRDMALQILQTNSQVMVKAGSPPEEWNVNLMRVSLIQTHINEIPWSHSPRCPSLSTLLLSNNQELKFIADSFFKQVDGLKVLDLACTKIETLPDSISDLVTLSALLLRSCWKLKHVPSLKKLVELRRLDLRDTALENVPQGMEWLSKLRDLRLSLCGQVEFPIGVLPKLSRLQIFELEELLWDDAYFPVTVKGKEVGCLRKLETLKCHFENLSDLADYLKSRDDTQLLNSYSFVVGQWDKIDYETVKAYHKFSTVYPHKGTVVLSNLNISGGQHLQVMFPNNIKQLMVCSCDDATSFCNFLSLIKNTSELEVLYIRDCNSIERLLSSSWIHSTAYETPSSLSIFSYLKEFNCYNCKSMKKLFPLALLPNLKNLEVICVKFCYKVEEIIASRVEDEEQDAVEDSRSYSITECNFLPNLRSLELDFLPELRSICSAKLACNSLKQISVYNCPKLKRMPFSLPLLDNGQPSPPTSLKRVLIDKKEWWESVEWDHPNAKDVLLPFVSYLWD